MFYDSFDTWWWPFVFIMLAAWLPTSMWRWAGVWLIGDVDEHSEVLVAVRCIATALVAAVIAQFIFFPSGAFAEFAMPIRMGAAVAGFVAYLLTKQNMIAGVVVGEAILVAAYFAA